MPAVPTVAVPSVMPADNALPYQNAAGATSDAFGGQIGTAEQALGAQIGQTGDVLSKHALRMQEDANVTSSEKLFLDQDIKLSKLTEDYNSLQGSARVNALPSQRSLAEYQDASNEVKLYMDRSLVSGAWTTRLQSMAKSDPLRARELYKKNIESIDGDARLKLEPQINQQIIQRDTAVQS